MLPVLHTISFGQLASTSLVILAAMIGPTGRVDQITQVFMNDSGIATSTITVPLETEIDLPDEPSLASTTPKLVSRTYTITVAQDKALKAYAAKSKVNGKKMTASQALRSILDDWRFSN